MILTRGLGVGGGLPAGGFGAWIGIEAAVTVPALPVVSRRDLRKKRRAELERQAHRRREAEFFMVGMP